MNGEEKIAASWEKLCADALHLSSTPPLPWRNLYLPIHSSLLCCHSKNSIHAWLPSLLLCFPCINLLILVFCNVIPGSVVWNLIYSLPSSPLCSQFISTSLCSTWAAVAPFGSTNLKELCDLQVIQWPHPPLLQRHTKTLHCQFVLMLLRTFPL